jgi:hypothetical protein
MGEYNKKKAPRFKKILSKIKEANYALQQEKISLFSSTRFQFKYMNSKILCIICIYSFNRTY